jgi:type I restriction enzyme S subunit
VTGLPRGWASTTLGVVADVLDHLRVPVNRKERERRSGDVPYYGATGQVGWIDRPLFDEELCLLGEDGAPFFELSRPKAYVITGPSWVNNHAHVLRARPCTTTKFLKYALDQVDYHSFVTGTTRPKLTKSAMTRIPLPLPPLAEQRRIVTAIEEQLSRLDAADASLTAARVRARLSRESILVVAFSNGARRQSIGAIGSLTDGPFGSNLKTSHYVAEGPRVVRLQNIGDGVFRDERAHISREHFAGLMKHAVAPGDVIVASLGEEAPRACLVPDWLGDAIVKADCIRFRPRDGVDPSYVMWALNSRPVKAQAATRIKGIGRPRLGLGGIRDLEIPLPPLDEQRRIVTEVEARLSALDALGASIELAQERSTVLRGAILAKAFRGELVLQDPDDEPATVLLERLANQRTVPPKRARQAEEKAPA